MGLKQKIKKRLGEQTANLTRGLKLADLPNPNTLLNNVAGAEMLANHLKNGDRVLIVGDYDADGILATSVLYGFLTDIGFTKDIVDYIIPSRLKDGYGLSPNIINYAKDNMFDVIVTVDNGIAAIDAIKLAKSYGIKVIVTDHHTAPAVLPDADIIINPKQPGETFKYIDISGATVAWYFACALKDTLKVKVDMRKYLDLAGLTVISDVMPLNHINLAILNFTIPKLKSRERFIYSLIWDDWSAPVINEVSIGFSFVPMINAIGRIDDANIGVRLFLSRDKNEITNLVEYIKEVNAERKALTQEFKAIALDIVQDNSDSAIVVRCKDYHEGIVGIIAGKLAEIYRVPAYVFAWSEEKQIWKGSGRSVGNVHLYELTNKAAEHILGFGGHKGAVGLGISPDQFEDFEKAIKEAARKIPKKEFLDKSLKPITCTLDEVSLDMLDLIESYGPFGEGNRLPPLTTKAKIKVEKELSNGLHFKCTATQNETVLPAMFFHVKNKEEFLSKIDQEELDITFYINRRYNPRTEKFDFDLFCTI